MFCFLVIACQYQYNQLPGKTRLRNDLSCVEWDIKPYTLTYSFTEAAGCFVALCAELKESNVNLKLTVVDTVGFGDQIDKTDRCVILILCDFSMLSSGKSCLI